MTRFIAPIAVAALILAGCGSSSNSSGSSGGGGGGNGGSAAKKSSGTSGGSGGGTTIDMKNIQFNPKEMTVKVGQKVTWDNEDSVDHNVTATAGASFKSENFGQGSSYSFTPKKAGTIKYTCTLHPGMDGVLKVTK